MGIANIIPGISGGTLALTLGIYEKLIDIISHFTKNIKEKVNDYTNFIDQSSEELFDLI